MTRCCSLILTGIVFFAWGEIYSLFPSTCTDTFGSQVRGGECRRAVHGEGHGVAAGAAVQRARRRPPGGWHSVFIVAGGHERRRGADGVVRAAADAPRAFREDGKHGARDGGAAGSVVGRLGPPSTQSSLPRGRPREACSSGGSERSERGVVSAAPGRLALAPGAANAVSVESVSSRGAAPEAGMPPPGGGEFAELPLCARDTGWPVTSRPPANTVSVGFVNSAGNAGAE